MNAKLCINRIRIGGPAWEFIRQVQNARHIPESETSAPEQAEARGLLESFHDANKPPEEIDLGTITGEKMLQEMDRYLVELRALPYFFSDAAKSKGEGITEGSLVTLLGDERIFEVLRISYEQESVRLRDDDDNEFVVPWRLVRPLENEEDVS